MSKSLFALCSCLCSERGGDGDGAADASAGYETDDGVVEVWVCGGEVGSFEAEGGVVGGWCGVGCLAS